MMEELIFFGISVVVTIIFVYLQKLIMKLSSKIWHFVPLIFFGVLFLYGFLRLSGIIVFYYDYNNDDCEFLGTIDCFIAVHGFLTSIITMIVIYLRSKKRPVIPVRKITGIFAAAISVFLIILIGLMVFRIASLDFNQTIADIRYQKLMKIGEYMFDKLHKGDFDTKTSFSKRNLSEFIDYNKNPDVYYAFYFSDFSDIGFLDGNTIIIDKDAFFLSVSGYLITDGKKSYQNGFLEIPGSGYDGDGIDIYKEYENIYSWRAGL